MPTTVNTLAQLLDAADQIILGKREHIRLALSALIARGHVLIEDVPGVGKTTLAHLLARLLGLNYQRIQFTSDMLPADIIGVAVFERESEAFRFHSGPLFSELILADEINRATPKTQSALLEAMEERQVTAEGETRPLPDPFFVIATQNPTHQIGTFPLPESQLDRFMLRVTLGYPDAAAERQLLGGRDRRELIDELQSQVAREQLASWQTQLRSVHAADPLLDYVQALLHRSRELDTHGTGLSPRAGLALLNAARGWAMFEQRDYLVPEDIQAVFPACAAHRLGGEGQGMDSGTRLAATLVDQVAIP